MKILIIDDEPLVRIGMKSIIDWNQFGYHIVGEAGNGQQGLQMIKQSQPDIALVDIMMPQMNGLEMIKKAKEEGYQGKFIILSCVSEIEYLQEAIKLGVSRYILKNSVNPDEILRVVNEISNELDKERVFSHEFGENYDSLNRHFTFQAFFNLILKGVITQPQQIGQKISALFMEPQKHVYLGMIHLKSSSNDVSKKIYELASVANSVIDEIGNGSCYVNFEDMITMIIGVNQENTLEGLSYRMKTSIKQYFNYSVDIVFKEIDQKTWDIESNYSDLKQNFSDHFFSSGKDTKEQNKKANDNILPYADYGNYKTLSSTLEIIRSMMIETNLITEREAKKLYVGSLEYVLLMFEITADELKAGASDKNSLYEMIENADNLDAMHKSTLDLLQKSYELAEKKGYLHFSDELTNSIINYIHKHCHEKISTNDVAEYFHFSVDYTCKYFKRKTQSNLTEYILKLKIYKSQELLLQGVSISNVASDFGFSSVGHYMKTFKRCEGQTPGEFMKKRLSSL
jgi:two-component system response regulator YesN